MKSLKHLVAGLGIALLGHTAVHAAEQILTIGVDFTYNEATGQFCDTAGCAYNFAGLGNFSQSDPLDAVSIKQNNVQLGLYTTNTYWDLSAFVAGGTDPTVNQTVAMTSIGIFDVWFGGFYLATDISTGQVTFANNAINVTGTGFSNIAGQNLPFGLTAYNPINFSFSSGTGVCANGICTYSGTAEMSWTTPVSEPATLALLGFGLLGLGLARRRRT